jgi:hypothetical protein
MFTRFAAIVMVLGATAGGPPEERLVVARVSEGVIFWHGHRINPPYEISVTFVTQPDTMLTNIYINNLPMVREPKRASGTPNQQDTTVQHQFALLQRAAAAKRAAAVDGADLQRQTLVWAEVLRSDRAFVDSVVVYPHVCELYWHGRRPGVTVPSLPWDGGPVGPRLGRALGIAGDLSRGRLVIIGQTTMTFGAERIKAALAEIEAVKRGGTTARPLIKNAAMREELRNPRPIDDLLRGE